MVTDSNVTPLFPRPVAVDPIDDVIHRGWKDEDIRIDFEGWLKNTPGFKAYMLEKEDSGEYLYSSVQSAWYGWLACRYFYVRRRLTNVE